jgi:hypothetical protein
MSSKLLANNLKLLYRKVYKHAKAPNRALFKSFFRNDIKNFNTKEYSPEDLNTMLLNYIQMRKFIEDENKLLESYNINVVREPSRDVENVAKKVGLKLSKNTYF